MLDSTASEDNPFTVQDFQAILKILKSFNE